MTAAMSVAAFEAEPPVIYVNRRGTASIGDFPGGRLAREAARLDALRKRAQPPESCGDEILVAPARGPCVAFQPRKVVQTSSGSWRDRRDGWQGRDAARVADAFDVMEMNARKAHVRWQAEQEKRAAEAERQVAEHLKTAGKGDRETSEDLTKKAKAERRKARQPFVPPFNHGQVQAARDYAALTERLTASGVKCSSLEAMRSSGGGGVSEAVARDMMRLAALHRRIGDGVAKDVLRPSKGGMRQTIYVRRLVDMVCVGGLTLQEVCERHGWVADDRVRLVLRAALCAALDRMQGYSCARPRNAA